jgi:mRNA interferase RelE/StbE
MMYKVKLSKSASKFYQQAEQSLAKKLARCFEILEINPLKHPNIKPLKGNLSGYYRYRIGNYRVIYYLENGVKIVVVTVIIHRQQNYLI